MPATDFTRSWFDQLETMLHADAELAGLLGHGTMIGTAREFFVSRVLKSVLPPSLHIATGRVLASTGSLSKQIDVIIYDPTFPLLETQPGQGVYLAEGVVAAIEVKSTLDKSSLHQALDNCLSVTSMPTTIMKRSMKLKLSDLKPTEVRDTPRFTPCAYIFAYKSQILSADTLCEHVGEWWESKGFGHGDIMKLPEIVVAGDLVGLCSGRWLHVVSTPGPEDLI